MSGTSDFCVRFPRRRHGSSRRLTGPRPNRPEALAATGIAEELGTSGGLVADVLAGLEADAGREEAARAVEGRLFDALSGFQLEPRGGCALEAFDAEWSPEAAGSAACAARVFDRKIRTMAAYRDAVHAGGEAGRGVVLFKHVHKAAGTSLCHHLRDRAGLRTEERPLPQHPEWDTDCVPQEAFRNRPAGAPDRAARTRTLRPADVPFGEAGASAETPAGFAGNSSAALGNATAAPWLGGNCWWGHLGPELQPAVPELFPGLQLVASEGPMPDAVGADLGFPMVTMLRAPVERTVSAYRWWERLHAEFPGINPGNCGAFDARNATTFDEWLAAYPSDWMTRELLGQAWLQDPERAIDARAFAFAVARLELFHGVLISEHFDRSVELLERLLGLDAAGEAVPRLVSAHHADELPAPQREAVRRKNEWDLRLYDRALALFREQLEKAGLDAPQQ